MKKALVLTYGVTCYSLFFALFLYMIGFLGNLIVPVSIGVGPEASTGAALITNITLILIFGLQHSIMARPAFKKAITKVIPKSIERSTYVLASTLALAALMFFWRPIPETIWDASATMLEPVLWSGYALGWGLLLLSTFLVNHFDLFGLKQVFEFATNREEKPMKFTTRALYKFVRHPIYLSWLIVTWCVPVMTVGHLVYALGISLYLLVAVPLEERDLVTEHGDNYCNYKDQVPAVLPSFRRRKYGAAKVGVAGA